MDRHYINSFGKIKPPLHHSVPLPSLCPLGENTEACDNYLTTGWNARMEAGSEGGEVYPVSSVQSELERKATEETLLLSCSHVAPSLLVGVEAAVHRERQMISRQRHI